MKQIEALQLEKERLTSTLDALVAEKASLAAALAEPQSNDESGDVQALKARIEQLEEELSVKAMEAEDHDTKVRHCVLTMRFAVLTRTWTADSRTPQGDEEDAPAPQAYAS